LNNCFVCGRNRSDFSKKSKNFDDHIEKEHDPWYYLYFLYYMKQKGLDELNGLEYYAWSNYVDKSTAFLPISGTMYLPENEAEELDNLEKTIEAIDKRVTSVSQSVAKIEELIERISKGDGISPVHPQKSEKKLKIVKN